MSVTSMMVAAVMVFPIPTHLEAALLELPGGPGAHPHDELPPPDGDLRGRVGGGGVADARREVHVAEHGQGRRRLHVLQGQKGSMVFTVIKILQDYSRKTKKRRLIFLISLVWFRPLQA